MVQGKQPKQAPSKVPTKKPQKLTKRVFCIVVLLLVWVFCSVVASQLVIGYLMVWTLGREAMSQPIWSGIYSVISYTMALFLIIFVPPKISAKLHSCSSVGKKNPAGTMEIKMISREQIGLNGMPTWTDIGLAPVGFIVGTLAAAALVWLFGLFPWFDAEQVQETGFSFYMGGGEKIIAFLVLVVLAPIVEEIIFRGWLYGKLRANVGMPTAIILVSMLFGIMHFQWNVGVNVFALSVVLCGLREITGTIYAGILTHMIKNGVAFYLLYVLGM